MAVRAASYNIWNIPVAPKTPARMAALCATLRANEGGDRLDIVGLQEAFLEGERSKLIAAAAEGGLPHAHFFRCGIGPPISDPTGLLVLSRWPVVEAAFWPFTLIGKPHKLQHFDAFCGKGVGLARVRRPDGSTIDVYVSHFVSVYTERVEDDEYLSHRVAEALEAARWINLTQRSPLALLLTDMNCPPESVPFRLVQALTGMRDALSLAKGGAFTPTYSYPGSPYVSEHHQRLDYVMLRGPYEVAWADRLYVDEVRGVVMSDHAAVAAELRPGGQADEPWEDLRPDSALLLEARAVLEAGLRDAVFRRWKHLAQAAATLAAAVLADYWPSLPLTIFFMFWCSVELYLSLVFTREEAHATRGALQQLSYRLPEAGEGAEQDAGQRRRKKKHS